MNMCLVVALLAGGESDHWAFRAPTRPAVPEAKAGEVARNPIDAFILAGLREFDLAPAPEADRPTLLRRASFDLMGLPPTPEQIDKFVNDRSEDAWERAVDRLLASPQFGVRWAQHWLDLARHADSDGYEFDAPRPDAWMYRDWVVNAFNADMPYDEFVRLQTAGDELHPDDKQARLATGFHRGYPDMPDMNDQGERRQRALDDITATTGLVFLGLTVGCARCHDHKIDPISQAEHYRLQAFFAAVELADPPKKGESSGGRVLAERTANAPPTPIRLRGEYSQPGPEVDPGIPAALGLGAIPIVPRPASTGRRVALANCLADPNNPLTARVMVNRLWQNLFGQGLVATPSDFGRGGEPPTHPELLDWLAVEFVERDWSVKAMLRLLTASATYRQSTRATPEALELDAENQLVGRQRRKRLDAESLRDALLAVSGTLNDQLGGPPVRPELPPEFARLAGNGPAWAVSADPDQRRRRSLYIFNQRNQRFPFLEVFDRPDTNASCPGRMASTTAPQALGLLNGAIARDAAAALADRACRDGGESPDARIAWTYRYALGRLPDAEERRLACDYLRNGPKHRWATFALTVLNLNEFLYYD